MDQRQQDLHRKSISEKFLSESWDQTQWKQKPFSGLYLIRVGKPKMSMMTKIYAIVNNCEELRG